MKIHRYKLCFSCTIFPKGSFGAADLENSYHEKNFFGCCSFIVINIKKGESYCKTGDEKNF